MIARKSLADIIDAYDDQISELNKNKRETFDAYRDQMVAERRTKPEIKIEIEAVKAAIKRRREAAKDEHALIEKDELIDEVFHEITRAPRATREIIEKFDAETGEVRDTKSPRKAAEAVEEMPRKDRNDDMPVVASGDVHRDTGSAMARTEASAVTDRRDDHLKSPIAPASQGEAEAPTPKDVSLPSDGVSSEGVATGGDHEDVTDPNAATHQAGSGLVSEPLPAIPGTVTRERDPSVPMHKAALAHCFPELSKSEYLKLRDSIIAIGISDPVIRKGDVILDGWCRYDIARSIGINYPVFEYDGSDELLDVIRWQRSSRDWTPQQEAKIAKALAAEVPARAEEIFAAFHIALNDIGEVVAA